MNAKMNAKTKVLSMLLMALFTVTACGSAAAGATAATATSGLATKVLTLVKAQAGPAGQPAAVTAAAVTAAATPAATSVAATSANAATAGVDSLQTAVESVYAQANPSVVTIVVTAAGNGYGYGSQASGSGFVYNANGMIVTNAHVVDGSNSIEVVFADGSHQSANLVGEDTANDLAVVQVAQLPASARPLTLAPDGSTQVGEFVAAIGSPFGEQNSLSFGIVSGLNRSMVSAGSSQRFVRNTIGAALKTLIQTDAPINPGNSGGPLLNLSGQVIGVDNAIESASGSSSGVGFAIPVSVVRQVVPAIIGSGG